MPFQLMVQDRSGENIARGISEFGRGVGRGVEGIFERMQKEKDRVKAEAREATSMRATLKAIDAKQAIEEGRQPNPHTFDLMGPDELKGTFRAVGVNDELEYRREQIKSLKANQLKLNREEASNAAFPVFARMMSEMGQAPESVPSPVNNAEFDRRTAPVKPQGVIEAMGASGYNPGAGTFDDIARMFGFGKNAGWNLGPNDIITDENGNQRVPVSPNSFQVVQNPDAKEPSIRMGIGEPNMFGGFQNNVTVTPSQYKKHKAALEDLGFKIQPVAPTKPVKLTVGQVMEGYRFKGGDPASQNSWEKVK